MMAKSSASTVWGNGSCPRVVQAVATRSAVPTSSRMPVSRTSLRQSMPSGRSPGGEWTPSAAIGLLDRACDREDRQVHGDEEAADDAAEEDHHHRLDQAGERG